MLGVAKSNADNAIPFIFQNDLQLLALVENGSKKAMSVADLVCHVCRTSGVTSLNLMEHDMVQRTQEKRVVSK